MPVNPKTQRIRLLAAAVTVGTAFSTSASAAQSSGVAPGQTRDVLQSIETVKAPAGTLLPKYSPEWFVGLAYTGTTLPAARQWPTAVASAEVLWARPGRFDFGSYLDLRIGRPDEHEGKFAIGFGALEVQWRAFETSFIDIAAVVRGAYLLDTTYPSNPMIRPGIGAQVSLVRSLAVLATYEPLFSLDRTLSSGEHFANGFGLGVKLGLCLFGECRQVRVRKIETLDRSPLTCIDAANVCQAVRPAAGDLCEAAQRALDSSRYPARWGDPVGAFLDALDVEQSPALRALTAASMKQLVDDHAASQRAIDEYGERLRVLKSDQSLSSKYSYLVTPGMVRDWMGCDVTGEPTACPTRDVCANDTGAAIEPL